MKYIGKYLSEEILLTRECISFWGIIFLRKKYIIHNLKNICQGYMEF